MTIQKGQAAPHFILFSSEKQQVSLTDFSGQPILILFFPQAFTSVCTTELCSVRDNMTMYNDLNVQVLGISVDSVFTLARYKADQQLQFPLLSDFNKEVSKAYGVLYETFAFDMRGVSKRASFVVDADGHIAFAEVLESAGDLPDFAAIHSVLDKIAASAI